MMPPPDTSKYTLPESTAETIFATRILPVLLAAHPHPTPAPSQASPPLAVLLVGQTGAGKSHLSRRLESAMLAVRGGPRPIHLVADLYKTYHPSYFALWRESPALASPATATDARRWLARAAAEVAARKLDVLVESACRHPGDFDGLAGIFRRAAYRVEVVVLAVPACLSRLGLIVRYARVEDGETADAEGQGDKTAEGERGTCAMALPRRLTPPKVHDDSFAGLMLSARFIDESDAVDHVVVVRRGGVVAWVGERDDTGLGWGRVEATLEAERRRRLTDAEDASCRADLAWLAATGTDTTQLVELVRAQEAAGNDAPELRGELVLPPLTDEQDVESLQGRMLRLGTGSEGNITNI